MASCPLLQLHSNLVIFVSEATPKCQSKRWCPLPAQRLLMTYGLSTKNKCRVYFLNCKWKNCEGTCQFLRVYQLFRECVSPFSQDLLSVLISTLTWPLPLLSSERLTAPALCRISSRLCQTMANWTLTRGNQRDQRWDIHTSFSFDFWQKIYLTN